MEKTTHPQQLAEHFFRHEYSKMVAVISRYFGMSRLDMSEDIVQDTLIEAMNHWEYNGIPENPQAWLYKVAKNKTLNVLNRDKYQQAYVKEVKPEEITIDFEESEFKDDLLQMMFACCHPSINIDSQTVLILKTLCGFSIEEMASAYLTNKETINKRLVRARKTLRSYEIKLVMPPKNELKNRLDAVLHTLYLLFNEGYNASSGDKLIRYELCLESIRLLNLIVEHPHFLSSSKAHALKALMLLNTSRFEARLSTNGGLVPMSEQDRFKWDQRLINTGLQHLEKTTKSRELSKYHILATISAYHCTATNYESTDWPGILSMYNALIEIEPSPLVIINRSIAVAKVDGPEEALQELETLQSDTILNYHFYHMTVAELLTELNRTDEALAYREKALGLTTNQFEKDFIMSKMNQC